MKLKSYSYLFSLIIIFYSPSLLSEEKIDIWQGKEKIKSENTKIEKKETNNNINRIESSQKISTLEKIKIEDGSLISASEIIVYGFFQHNRNKKFVFLSLPPPPFFSFIFYFTFIDSWHFLLINKH